MRLLKRNHFRANQSQKRRDYGSGVMPEFRGQYEVRLKKRRSTHDDYGRTLDRAQESLKAGPTQLNCYNRRSVQDHGLKSFRPEPENFVLFLPRHALPQYVGRYERPDVFF